VVFRNTLSAKAKVPKITRERKAAKMAKIEKVKDQAMDLTPPRERPGGRMEKQRERVSMTLKETLIRQQTVVRLQR
jgi:hypothetical protein